MAKKLSKSSFTKSDLVQEICNKHKNLTKNQAKLIVHCIFESIANFLKNKQRVEIRGFGSFGLKKYEARLGKNPQTGEIIQVKSKILPFFKIGKLRENIDPSIKK